MRRPISSKSDSCTESAVVDRAGISGKVSVSYPGRSAPPAAGHERLAALRSDARGRRKSAEGIVRPFDAAQGPNMRGQGRNPRFDEATKHRTPF